MKRELFPYQVEGIRFLSTGGNKMLLDEMGLGKTVQAIRAADKLDYAAVIVVCPAIARENWRREFLTWQKRPRRVAVLTNTKSLANKVWKSDVLIVSSAAISNAATCSVLCDWANAGTLLILDEGQYFKTPDSARTRAVYGTMRKSGISGGLAHRCGATFVLSGTLMPNNTAEMWTHVRALFPSLCYTSDPLVYPVDYETWRDWFCYAQETAYGVMIRGSRPGRTFGGRFAEVALRRRASILDLPPLRWGTVTIQPQKVAKMPPFETQEAEQLCEMILLAAGDDESEEAAIAAAQVDAIALAAVRRWTGLVKAPGVVEMLLNEQQAEPHPVVVFFYHREVGANIVAALLNAGQQAELIYGSTPPAARQSMIDAFQANRLRILVCQITVASTALTLTASRDVVFAETTWTPGDVLQAAKRCHRIGQMWPVLARLVTLAGSIDEVSGRVIGRKVRDLAAIDPELEGHTPAERTA